MSDVRQAGLQALVGALVVVAAVAVTVGLILALRPLLRRYALARPNARSSHREPTPQGGGLAVCTATIAAAAVAAFGLPQTGGVAVPPLAPLFGAVVLIALVGVLDDIRTLAVAPRLLLQVLAVAVVIAGLPPELRVVAPLPWWIERVLLLVGGVWFVNLVNFMDGMDWMTVAEVVPLTVGLVFIGILGALPTHAILVALALLGATLGFAPFNRPVARLFLGDVGSLPIGLMIGWLLVLVAGSGHLAAAVLLPLYYLADASLTLLRRLLRGERVWQAHRTHFYQRATDRGLSVLEIVGRVLAANIVLGALAVATVLAPTMTVSLAALAIGGALVGWLLVGFARGRT